jgi:surface polysaccharide O-acyltransferase-like enzyme
MFAAGYFVTFKGFRTMSSNPDVTNAGLELFWTYCSLNTVLMTVAVFLFVQKIRLTSAKVIATFASIAKCSFGMYMCHYFFVGPAYLIAVEIGTPVYLQIPVSASIVFITSWTLVHLIYKLPKAKYVVG